MINKALDIPKVINKLILSINVNNVLLRIILIVMELIILHQKKDIGDKAFLKKFFNVLLILPVWVILILNYKSIIILAAFLLATL